MANLTVVIVKLVQADGQWKRLPVAYGRNGRPKPGVVLIDGKEIAIPNGDYYLRYYEGRKLTYKKIGPNAGEAYIERQKLADRLKLKSTGEQIGIEIELPDEKKRPRLRRKCEDYIDDRKKAHKLEAAEQARLVSDEFLLVARKTFVDEVTREDIFRFHKTLRDRGCAPRTVANKHARLKAMLKFAGLDVDGIMPDQPDYDEALPTIYSSDEIRKIQGAADDYMRLVIDMGLKLGLREQELIHAEWADVDWEANIFRVRSKPELGFRVKDAEERDVPCPTDLITRLEDWEEKHPSSTLILATAGNQPNRKLLRTLKRLAKRAGLNCKICEGCTGRLGECKHWTLHKLRRTYCTKLLRHGVDLATVQGWMGHKDLASTMRYLRPAAGKEAQVHINSVKW